jgi:hypothetical protein
VLSEKITDQPTLVILTGGNITPEDHAQIVQDVIL